MCTFARQNVCQDPPFSRIDLVTCRNVLIYLGPQLQRKCIPVFHYALNPDGYLMLGTSESVGGYADLFALVDKKHKIYVKKATALRPGSRLAPHGNGEPSCRIVQYAADACRSENPAQTCKSKSIGLFWRAIPPTPS